jgi:hypothetical protein
LKEHLCIFEIQFNDTSGAPIFGFMLIVMKSPRPQMINKEKNTFHELQTKDLLAMG